MIKTFNYHEDKVIKSLAVTGEITYRYALEKIHPLIDKFHSQRKLLDIKFYERLENDILEGCIMPPITLAFVTKELNELKKIEHINSYINKNITKGYILDGIQRINTLERASKREDKQLDLERPLLVNIVIAENQDMLLYRMITLNNGQKPMSPRHQIEILTKELFNFDDYNINVQTEKDRSEQIIRGSFNLGDISRGYLAFLTNAVHNENNKIISEKMDEILVGRIFKSDITRSTLRFEDVLALIDKFAENEEVKKWLKIANNLIGFCVGSKLSFSVLENISSDEFLDKIKVFEGAFKAVNPSKVNLGKYRRELSKLWIKNINEYSDFSELQLTEVFVNETSS